jgi:hypothetical protein
MKFERMVIEKESPEEYGYNRIKNMLTERSIPDQTLAGLGININLLDILLSYTDHSGNPQLLLSDVLKNNNKKFTTVRDWMKDH